jgi:uncharacterized protein YaaN involved in tellurite resistance
MALENAEVLANLKEQRETLEKQLNEGNAQIEQLKSTYLKVVGAIDVLGQIEESNNPTAEGEDSAPDTVVSEDVPE